MRPARWRTARQLAWVGSLCLLAAACEYRQPPLPHLGPDDVILASGDNLTDGCRPGATAIASLPRAAGAL